MEYGYHLDANRQPVLTVEVAADLADTVHFGAMGNVLGKKFGNKVLYITGIPHATTEQLKSLCASIATYGGTALFHMAGITPEEVRKPEEKTTLSQAEIDGAIKEMTDPGDVDFVAIGCPHCSLEELRKLAELLNGKKVTKETWIACARPVKEEAEREGIVEVIEASGAKFAADTCFVVAPIRGRFRCMATNSAKGIYYGRAKNRFKTVLAPFERLIELATDG